MREETHIKLRICVVCKKQITEDDTPVIVFKDGEQVHVACWSQEESERHEPS